MAVIKIENFGGEMPSVSARALPDAAAQENSNLFAGTAEFRPLKSDVSAGTSVAAAKSLFRIDPHSPGSPARRPAAMCVGRSMGM